MARSKTLELPSGESVVINALKLKEQKHLIKIVGDLIKLIGNLTQSPDALAKELGEFVESKWDEVVELIEASLPSPEEADKIVGIDDIVEVLVAVYEVNGVPNLLKRLEPMMANMAQALTSMVQNVEPEKGPELTQLKPKQSS